MRKLRRGAAFAVTLALMINLLVLAAAVTPGSFDDPVVTLGWLTGVFQPRMLSEAGARASKAFDGMYGARYDADRGRLNALLAQKIVSKPLADAVAARVAALRSGSGGQVNGKKGEKLTVPTGVSVVLHKGAAYLHGDGAVDLTSGVELPGGGGNGIPGRHKVVFTGTSGGMLEFTMDSSVTVCGPYTLRPLYSPKYGDLAAALNGMGLMIGDGKGYYALERGATRIEGLVLMIRMVGDDSAALAHTGTHPLTDVPDWADRYMAYAYSMGWAQGVGGNRFAPDEPIDSGQFMTLLLRAMGYDDGDFSWDQSLSFAECAGVITPGERAMLQNECRRDQLAYMSYYALDGMCKNSVTLLQKLIEKGAFSEEQARRARAAINRARA